MKKYLKYISIAAILLSLNISLNAQTSTKDTIYILQKEKRMTETILPNVEYINLDQDPIVRGYKNFYECLKEKYTQPTFQDVEYLKVTGNVFGAYLRVTKEGKIQDIDVVYKVAPHIDAELVELIKTIEVVSPGIKGNKDVDTQVLLTLPIRAIERANKLDLSGFWLPSFQGGQEALMRYIKSNLKYPSESAKNKIEGRVIVKFFVTNRGKIVDAQVVQSLNKDCDGEALRVVNEMPDWLPALINNIPMSRDMYYILPVNFRLTKGAKNRK